MNYNLGGSSHFIDTHGEDLLEHLRRGPTAFEETNRFNQTPEEKMKLFPNDGSSDEESESLQKHRFRPQIT